MRRLMLLGLILLGVASCARTQSDPALMAATPPTVDVTGTWAGNWAYTNVEPRQWTHQDDHAADRLEGHRDR